MDLVISAISQGLLWSLLSLGLFISFRILNVADMTTEGAYPLGAAVCVVLIQSGFSPFIATIIAMLVGSLADLLPYFDIILLGLIILFIVILAMFLFFNTELGQALIATGDNPKMAISLGISTKKMTTIGLMLSNSMIALTGAILSQNNGYADVNSGLGVIVVALAAIIIGEVIFTDVNFLTRLVCIVFGSIIYRLLLVFVLKLNVIEANDFKMVSALLIAIFLSIPELKKLSLSKVGKGNK